MSICRNLHRPKHSAHAAEQQNRGRGRADSPLSFGPPTAGGDSCFVYGWIVINPNIPQKATYRISRAPIARRAKSFRDGLRTTHDAFRQMPKFGKLESTRTRMATQ